MGGARVWGLGLRVEVLGLTAKGLRVLYINSNVI